MIYALFHRYHDRRWWVLAAGALLALDLLVGPMLLAWELALLKDALGR